MDLKIKPNMIIQRGRARKVIAKMIEPVSTGRVVVAITASS